MDGVMFLIAAARREEPGERVDDKLYYGVFGVFDTLAEATVRAKALNLKGGYRDIRILELADVTTRARL